ncbi:UDP-galactopyranose mutase [Kitasatospora sp. NPDC054768]
MSSPRRRPDVAIVGAGLVGLVVAERLTALVPGVQVLVVEASGRLGGLCASQWNEHLGVNVHPRGTHVLATSSRRVWAYLTAQTRVIPYRHRVFACYQGELIPLPLGLEAVEAVYGAGLDPDQARSLVEKDAAPYRGKVPLTVEEVALASVGPRLYEAFVHGHVSKQWGVDPSKLAPEVFTSRFGLTYTRDNQYHPDARYQGLPAGGWGAMLHRLADRPGIRIELGRQASADDPPEYTRACLVTSPIDQWFGFDLGALERRSLAVEWRRTEARKAPKAATITYPDLAVPYYRTHAPALLPGGGATVTSSTSLVGYERHGPGEYQVDFVLRSPANKELADAYRQRAKHLAGGGLVFAGRGATFYDDMGTSIAAALTCATALSRRLCHT